MYLLSDMKFGLNAGGEHEFSDTGEGDAESDPESEPIEKRPRADTGGSTGSSSSQMSVIQFEQLKLEEVRKC